jgi:hypothetical protein
MTRKSAKVANKTLAKRDAAKVPRKAVPNPTELPSSSQAAPADREGLQRCAGAGLHCGDAG